MRLNYQPQSSLEKFAHKVYSVLVENFPRTYYVGGMVRDRLLHKKVTDIDIATSATPEQVKRILSARRILFDDHYQNFGIIIPKYNKLQAEIASFRKDLPGSGRYPKVDFVQHPKTDSIRRDFTVNALYFSQISGKILDFHDGLSDLKSKRLRFIGDPARRIAQDPLRIIRAWRFAGDLGFVLEAKTARAIKNNLYLIERLTKARLAAEFAKTKKRSTKKFITSALAKIKNA